LVLDVLLSVGADYDGSGASFAPTAKAAKAKGIFLHEKM
jgi:hypothetical protein